MTQSLVSWAPDHVLRKEASSHDLQIHGYAVYRQSLEDGVRSTVSSIHKELSGTGTWGSCPQPNAAASANHTRLAKQLAEVAKDGEIEKLRAVNSGKEKALAPKPVRAVVLEFATRMRQSRGSEVTLND
jgi:hypothetical protein